MNEFIEFPTTNFSLDCGSDPKVREWLKQNGVSWSSGDDPTTYLLQYPFLEVENKAISWSGLRKCLSYPIINPYKGQNIMSKVDTSTKVTIERPEDLGLIEMKDMQPGQVAIIKDSQVPSRMGDVVYRPHTFNFNVLDMTQGDSWSNENVNIKVRPVNAEIIIKILD